MSIESESLILISIEFNLTTSSIKMFVRLVAVLTLALAKSSTVNGQCTYKLIAVTLFSPKTRCRATCGW